MRGPFDEAVPAYVVFGLDRGAGGSFGPRFVSRPEIAPDLIVAIRVAPFGASASGIITDLTTGAVVSIDPSRIRVNGSTVRVFLNPTQVASKGLAMNRYRFALWTQDAPGGIETVGSFLPDASMIRVGVQK